MQGAGVSQGLVRASRLFGALLAATLLSFAVVAVADAQSEGKAVTGVRDYEVPVSGPEGVYYDSNTRAFYGGSANDGEIYKAKLDGLKIRKVRTFMPVGRDAQGNVDTRTAAHGINVDSKKRMYIAGVTSGDLHVYQLPKGNKIATFSTGSGGYINDVDIAPNGDVYFTDSLRPTMWRVTAQQVAAGEGDPQAIPLGPEVDYGLSGRTPLNLEANGIRFTPNGKYIIFNSINNGMLYRMTPPPRTNPEARVIVPVTGITPEQLGNTDGLEFLNAETLYSMDNSGQLGETTPGAPGVDESPERLVKVQFTAGYTKAKFVKAVESESFRTPATISLAPNNRILVSNLELFDDNPDTPAATNAFVTSLPRP